MTTDESYDLLNTILEKDYYIPDVSELCIGFEYSYRAGNNIVHRVIESKNDLEFTFHLLLDNNLFVKKLDEDDIESLGFIQHTGDFDYVLDKFTLIKVNQYVTVFSEQNILFREGVIRNKSELRRLLKQLKIC